MIPPKNDHSGPTNPFRPGMGLDPPYLADRAAQLDRFDKYLTGFPTFPRNVRLTGLRGVGKTVLLQHYAAAAEARGWVVVRRECSWRPGRDRRCRWRSAHPGGPGRNRTRCCFNRTGV